MKDYTVIDSKTESHDYLFEKVYTVINLLNMGDKKVGLSYAAKYSGVKNGHVSGGPYEIDGDLSRVVNKDPEVTLQITSYQNTGDYASMRVKIIVHDAGTHTIFDETLEGNYSAGATGWSVALASVVAASEMQGKKALPKSPL